MVTDDPEETDETEAPLDDTDVHDILRNDRRRAVITILTEDGNRESVRELSEQIASEESGVYPPPRDARQSVYVSLHQTHLPKLDQHGIVEYDVDAKIVESTDRCTELRKYMDVDVAYAYARRHAIFTAVIGAFSAVVILAAWSNILTLTVVPPALWAGVVLMVLALSGVYLFLVLSTSVSLHS